MKKFDTKKLLFLIIFVILGLIALKIPFTHIIGSKQTFTAFDFIAPITGGFLGSWFGALAVGIVELINFFTKHMTLDTTTFIRFWPMLLAAVYFGSKIKWLNIIVPATCIILFLANPIGRTVWYYPLTFWLIPIVAAFFKNRLSVNAIGSTMTAHAVGSTLFLYAFALPASVWKSLMAVVPFERLTFAVGIIVSYLVINNVLDYLVKKLHAKNLQPLVNPKLLFNKSIFANL